MKITYFRVAKAYNYIPTYWANSKEFKEKIKITLFGKYHKNFQILFDYYNWLKDNKSNWKHYDYINHLKLNKDYCPLCIDWIHYFLNILTFKELLKESPIWESSLNNLLELNPLTDDNEINQKIIEDWIINKAYEQKNPTRNALILLSIYGKELINYLRLNTIL